MQVTDIVRVVRSVGLIRTALFAAVLSVQPPNADDDGTNGEPTITIAYLDLEKASLLGGPKWYEAFKRVPTVRHVSHPDVQTGAEEYCYTEVLASDGGPVHLQSLNMDAEDGPAAEAADAPSTIGTIVYLNHSNNMGVIHRDENSFVAVTASGVPIHEPFSDLFSATVYVDSQPADPLESEAGRIASEAGFPMPIVAAAIERKGLGQQTNQEGDKQIPWAQLTEEERDAVVFPTWDGIVTRSGKTEADLKADHDAIRQQEEEEAAQKEKENDPPPSTPESIAAQNEHDRVTGNVNEANQTPAEAVAAEQQQQDEGTAQQ
ncbi:MAG TPA: hypothetical protein VGU67_02875 [Edaphobacter sp.]|nr:hypothetical protein [Edaphobacter sp.]